MTLLLVIPGRDNTAMVQNLQEVDPCLSVAVWPEVPYPEEVVFAVTWYHPPGALRGYPNLRGISSLGAGVDHLLGDPQLPDVPIARVIDLQLVREMREYLLLTVLNRHREWDIYAGHQRKQDWIMRPARRPPTISILGLGQMGASVAESFVHLGYSVLGWSRHAKVLPGVCCHHGPDGLDEVLAVSDVLICLLPLTSETRNMLNRDLFEKVKSGCYLINVGRGAHLVEEDLIPAIDSGHLSGACLDVFSVEPLPAEHPFWRHPSITVTPHIASRTDPRSVARLLVENYQRAREGKKLKYLVNPQKEY